VGQQGSASGSLLLDLDGLQVVTAELVGGEWQLAVQTTATMVGCAGCGIRATPYGRRLVRVQDLPIGGRPVVLAWRKRLWRCREPACGVRTWTERVTGIAPRTVLTQRARAEACRRVGKDAHAVAAVARDLGVGWATIMRAVADHGTPLVEDPTRLDGVAALGLDETSFLKATRLAPTRWVTGWSIWSAAGCWMWWPTAPVPRWTAGLVAGRLPGWPASARWRWTPGTGMPARWSPRLATSGWSWTTPRRPAGQRGGRPGAPSRGAGHPWASGPQARSAVPHPQAAADRRRAAHRTRTGRLRAGLAAGQGSVKVP
jgi:zinc-finger of transposase IS204/IS1001/IS1096/IS1165/Helix-turn-helix domain of transposase family ISL3